MISQGNLESILIIILLGMCSKINNYNNNIMIMVVQNFVACTKNTTKVKPAYHTVPIHRDPLI